SYPRPLSRRCSRACARSGAATVTAAGARGSGWPSSGGWSRPWAGGCATSPARTAGPASASYCPRRLRATAASVTASRVPLGVAARRTSARKVCAVATTVSDAAAGMHGREGGPILVATGVHKTYRTGAVEVEALRGVDLRVERGEYLGVMGPSGNGKTTMLNCLSGLDDIDAGTVLVEGEDIHAMSDSRRTEHRSRHMGFIFQSFNLIPVFTAVENVELPLLLAGAKAGQARAGAAEMLDRVGLGNRLDHRPGELSGGEQQRVAVARALVSG